MTKNGFDKRKTFGILISLAVTFIVLCAIIILSNHKYAQENREVEVLVTTKFIPVGREIKDSDISTVKVPEKMAAGLVKKNEDNPNPTEGKCATVSLMKGQYIWESSISKALPQKEGHETVYIHTDLSSSACVVAGDRVNIYLVDKTNAYTAREPVYRGALVLSSRDSGNTEIDPGARVLMNEVASSGGKVPVCVGLDVPTNIASLIVNPASKKAVYLTLSEIRG